MLSWALCGAGDTASSCRLFDAILSHCIPVVVSDSLELPFEEELDYTKFALFVPQRLAVRPGFLVRILEETSMERGSSMWQRLKEVGTRKGRSGSSRPSSALAALNEPALGVPFRAQRVAGEGRLVVGWRRGMRRTKGVPLCDQWPWPAAPAAPHRPRPYVRLA